MASKREFERKIVQCITYRKRIVQYLKDLNSKLSSGEITHPEYKEISNRTLDGKTLKEWFEFYGKHINEYSRSISDLN